MSRWKPPGRQVFSLALGTRILIRECQWRISTGQNVGLVAESDRQRACFCWLHRWAAEASYRSRRSYWISVRQQGGSLLTLNEMVLAYLPTTLRCWATAGGRPITRKPPSPRTRWARRGDASACPKALSALGSSPISAVGSVFLHVREVAFTYTAHVRTDDMLEGRKTPGGSAASLSTARPRPPWYDSEMSVHVCTYFVYSLAAAQSIDAQLLRLDLSAHSLSESSPFRQCGQALAPAG